MTNTRKLNLVLQVIGLVVCALIAAILWPISAQGRGEIAAAYHQYLPFVRGVDCVPPIPPNDIDKDLAVEARINEIRDQNGLPRFTNSSKLTQAALRHSNDMADNNFFDHTGSDGSSAPDRLEQACYNWQAYGEIIAAGYKTPASVVEAWMGGPGHRGIILDSELAEFGAGYAYNRSSNYKHYWTVDFGLQANASKATLGDYHPCSYHLKDSSGEIRVRLYTNQPCALYGGELREKFIQE